MHQVARSLHVVETRLGGASGQEASQLRAELERLSAFQSELSDFRAELLRVAALPYRPNLDDGVIINAAPLHTLFRHRGWAGATRDCWQKLERGDYDWAHLAYQRWPERVREKCRSDRSLAIAHDLEDLYVAPPAPSKKAGKRGRPQATLLAEDDA